MKELLSDNGSRAHTKVILVALATASLVATAAAGDQLLIDPSFEDNPLIGYYEVLNYFEQYQGNWGVENAVIVGATGSVIPPHGEKMLQMWDDGLIVTQAFQVTDVSAFSSLIDSGKAVGLLGALFNTNNVPQARTVVHISFYSGPGVAFEIGTFWSLMDLDADVNTWETNLAQTSVPVGTRWVVSDIAYDNQLLQGNPGYFDAASLRIVPEPASLLTLGAGLGLFAWRQRSRRVSRKLG
ncbi:MAG: PEP-CTERM sorting domain-containing protein [Armatimonadota bacterium]|nr:PEP-CTERM sorting domain-containing protein [Armatimonadota bacterium]